VDNNHKNFDPIKFDQEPRALRGKYYAVATLQKCVHSFVNKVERHFIERGT
jgi:hypothetical protein